MTHRTAAAIGQSAEPRPRKGTFLKDVIEGLTARPKFIPSKYFYDARGSRLFDEITELDEYYPTRTELSIMERHLDEMVACLGTRCLLVEYGSGSSLKTRILLDAMDDPAGYVPIDISSEHLAESARRLADAYPELDIHPISADYTGGFELPDLGSSAERTVVFFPGSTIGNFEPPAARDFLTRMAQVAGPRGGLLIGVDLEKEPAVLEAAYNDAGGVTAAFNKNLLHRIHTELNATIDPDAFRHEAVYNRREGRIEMYLVSQAKQTVRVDGIALPMKEGERICTEYSYKYTRERFAELASSAGFQVRQVWMDEDELFSVQYLET